MKSKQIIPTRGTPTTRGFIPHYELNGIQLPVKVRYPEKYSKRLWEMRPRPPVTEDGRIVYAMPGGGELISEVEL